MTATATTTPPKTAPSTVWLFFAFVLCWTWCFWGAAAVLSVSALSPLGIFLEVGGLLGPMLGGIGFAYFTLGDAGWHDYWRRVVDPGRIGPTGWLVILLLAPALFATAVLLDVVVNGSGAVDLVRDRLMQFASSPQAFAANLFWLLVYGPLPEELGWRGYALDRLQAKWSAMTASLVLGVVWAVWHVPLFFINDTLFSARGAWSPWFWQFAATVVAFAIVFTWVFNTTRRSTMAAIVLHLTTNLAASSANVTAGTNFYSTVLWIAAAIVVIVAWKVKDRRDGQLGT
jgi:membrane protease YdiL (CAAX protease family)